MLLALIAALVLNAAPGGASAFRVVESATASQTERGVVSARQVSDLLQWVRGSSAHIVHKWEKAVEVFSKGWTVERYPVSVSDPTSRLSARGLYLISPQLERDGVKVSGVRNGLPVQRR